MFELSFVRTFKFFNFFYMTVHSLLPEWSLHLFFFKVYRGANALHRSAVFFSPKIDGF